MFPVLGTREAFAAGVWNNPGPATHRAREWEAGVGSLGVVIVTVV